MCLPGGGSATSDASETIFTLTPLSRALKKPGLMPPAPTSILPVASKGSISLKLL